MTKVEDVVRMDMATYRAFLETYCDFYDELVALGQEKLEIISTNSLHLLEDFVKREQVYVLKARGLEEKRVKLQQSTGLADWTMQEIIERAEDGQEQQCLRQLRVRLNNAVAMVRSTNEICDEMIGGRLKTIDEKIGALGAKNKAAEGQRVMNRSI